MNVIAIEKLRSIVFCYNILLFFSTFERNFHSTLQNDEIQTDVTSKPSKYSRIWLECLWILVNKYQNFVEQRHTIKSDTIIHVLISNILGI